MFYLSGINLQVHVKTDKGPGKKKKLNNVRIKTQALYVNI